MQKFIFFNELSAETSKKGVRGLGATFRRSNKPARASAKTRGTILKHRRASLDNGAVRQVNRSSRAGQRGPGRRTSSLLLPVREM
jgi:hypothetical protein